MCINLQLKTAPNKCTFYSCLSNVCGKNYSVLLLWEISEPFLN